MKMMKKNENNSQVIPIYGPMVNFYPSEEIGCKATMFICDGNNNESVLYIKVKGRKGKLNIIETIRQSLKRIKGVDKSAQIGVGGVIKVLKGKVNTHISPDFVQVDYNNKEAIEKTYKYYEFGPNLMMFTTFLTDDPSENGKLHLTLQSTNCYSLNPHCNEGGVFVESATDDIIEYEGYFNFAKYIYRV
eukprot:939185_1